MTPESEVVKILAKTRREEAIKAYKAQTDILLKKADLSTEEKLKLVYCNQDNRLAIIKKVQQHTFEHLFKKKPETFFKKNYHYDWWIFPMYVPKKWDWSQRNYDAAINLEEAKALLVDAEFLKTYQACLGMYLSALKKHGWNDYPVRYARMLHSLSIFIDAASSMKAYCKPYKNLISFANQAVNYAMKNIKAHYEDDDLLIMGLSLIQERLDFFRMPTKPCLEHEESSSSLSQYGVD